MNDKIYLLILGCVALETLIMLIITIYNLIRILFQKSKRVYGILVGVLFLIEYFIMQAFLLISKENDLTDAIGFNNKTVELILLQAAMTVVVLALTQNVRRWEKKTLTKTSLKEGLDSLPVGLLFPEDLLRIKRIF